MWVAMCWLLPTHSQSPVMIYLDHQVGIPEGRGAVAPPLGLLCASRRPALAHGSGFGDDSPSIASA